MRWSIRNQLLIPVLAVLAGLAGVCAWSAQASAARAWRQIETQVQSVARTLANSSFPLTESVLDMMRGLSGAEYIFRDANGRILSTLPQADLPPGEPGSQDWRHLHLEARIQTERGAFLFGSIRLKAPSAAIPGTLYILYPESLWRDAFWEAVRPALILGGTGGLFALFLSVGMAQHFSRRVRELERRTRQIAAGDFGPMPLSGQNDELRDLARSVNEMAERLSQMQQAMQANERLRLLGQVSGGLAHQLRNAATGARLAVQLHARECLGGVDHEDLRVALRQLDLLESNLKRFLDLGRENAQRFEPCSLRQILAEVVALLDPQCRHLQTVLCWQEPAGDFVIRGENGQLGQLFLNVIKNGVEAAGPRGCVELTLKFSPDSRGWCRIEVCDTGPGPPASIQDRLFTPFVTSKQGGVGLGLAIARQVVQAHGGRLSWQRQNERTCFIVELPSLEESR